MNSKYSPSSDTGSEERTPFEPTAAEKARVGKEYSEAAALERGRGREGTARAKLEYGRAPGWE